MNPLIHDKKIFSDCFVRMQKQKWTCMAPNCQNQSIKSHVLQKNGVLSHISKEGHIIEVKPTTIWEMDDLGSFKYQEIGINDGFAFPGFCQSHDDQIFGRIEKEDLDPTDYLTQCLFSYRGLCQEIRRKQQVKLMLEDVLSKRSLFRFMNIQELFDDYVRGLGYGIKNLSYFKEQLEEDINNGTQNFEFEIQKLPLIGICTSAPLNIKEPNEPEPESLEEYERGAGTILPTTFLSLYPTSSNSILIVGQHINFPSSYTSKILSTEYQTMISELLILRMEYWCMSHEFLENYIKPKENEIRTLFMQNALNFGHEIENSINLFK